MYDLEEYPAGTTFSRQSVEPPVGRHFGVYLGNDCVLDLQKGADCAFVRIVPFEDFAAGMDVWAEPPTDTFSEDVFWERVQEARNSGCISYGLLSQGADWNCESLTNWLVSGVKRSVQGEKVVVALKVAGVATAAGLAAWGIAALIRHSQRKASGRNSRRR